MSWTLLSSPPPPKAMSADGWSTNRSCLNPSCLSDVFNLGRILYLMGIQSSVVDF